MRGNFFDFMNRLGDLVILNIVFVVSCIPIITIGPSLAALYCVTQKMADGNDGYVVRGFFKAFSGNFRQGITAGIVAEIFGFVLVYDAISLYHSKEAYAQAGLFITILALVLAAMIIHFLFPLIARYNNTLRASFMNALILSVSKLPQTLLLVLLTLFCVIVCYLSIFGYLYVGLFGCSFCAYLQSRILRRIFSTF